MAFWLFKKKKKEEGSEHIESLHHSLKSSFSNLKVDMKNISDWIGVLDEKDQQQDQELSKLKNRIISLEAKVGGLVENLEEEEVIEEPVAEKLEEIQYRVSAMLTSFQSLTDTQKRLFKTLFFLQKEKNWKWILLKDLANELYPTRSYSAVRSTISDYLGLLEEVGLSQRKRVSRQSMASLTDQGKDLMKLIQEEIEDSTDHSPRKKPAKRHKH